MTALNLNTVLVMIAASTPDGRWAMLQAWLKKNPKMRSRVNKLSTQPIDEVVDELEIWAAKKYGPAVSWVLQKDDMRQKIKTAIENLQARYRERVNQNQPEQQKEIKNVKTKRTVKIGPPRPRKNPKRKT